MRTLLVRVLRELREVDLASLPTEFEDYGPAAAAVLPVINATAY